MPRSFNTLEPFLLALRAALVANGTWTESCCHLSMDEDQMSLPPGSPVLYIIPGKCVSWPGGQNGGGIEVTVLIGKLTFKLCLQNTLDQVNSDWNALTSTDTTMGIYALVGELIDTIQMWDGCSNTNQAFLIQPLRLGDVGKPYRSKEHSQYIYCDVTAEFMINQAITGAT